MALGPWVPCYGELVPFPCVTASWEAREHVGRWRPHARHLAVMGNNRQWEGPLRQQGKDKWWEGEGARWALLQGPPGCVGIGGPLEEAIPVLGTRVVRSGQEAGQMEPTTAFGDV